MRVSSSLARALRRGLGRGVWLAGLLAASLSAGLAQGGAARIAAASDLKFALDEVIAGFKAQGGQDVVAAYGSSGHFKTQILQGAPFEMFMSADEGFVFELADRGFAQGRGAPYAIGRLVLFAPTSTNWTPDPAAADFTAALADGRIAKFAIANPEHAPYGRAAEEALQSLGLWERVRPKLVLGENVSQAAQFATSGSTQGGIFALSLALSPSVGKLGTYALIPADRHRPLRQQMVLLRGAGEAAANFYAYVQSPAARDIFRRYGFLLPGEEG